MVDGLKGDAGLLDAEPMLGAHFIDAYGLKGPANFNTPRLRSYKFAMARGAADLPASLSGHRKFFKRAEEMKQAGERNVEYACKFLGSTRIVL